MPHFIELTQLVSASQITLTAKPSKVKVRIIIAVQHTVHKTLPAPWGLPVSSNYGLIIAGSISNVNTFKC